MAAFEGRSGSVLAVLLRRLTSTLVLLPVHCSVCWTSPPLGTATWRAPAMRGTPRQLAGASRSSSSSRGRQPRPSESSTVPGAQAQAEFLGRALFQQQAMPGQAAAAHFLPSHLDRERQQQQGRRRRLRPHTTSCSAVARRPRLGQASRHSSSSNSRHRRLHRRTTCLACMAAAAALPARAQQRPTHRRRRHLRRHRQRMRTSCLAAATAQPPPAAPALPTSMISSLCLPPSPQHPAVGLAARQVQRPLRGRPQPPQQPPAAGRPLASTL